MSGDLKQLIQNEFRSINRLIIININT